VGDFAAALSERTPAPGGGSAAAASLALSAGLCAMAARFSERQLGERAGEVAELADAIRMRALELADEDASAYAFVLAARRLGPSVPAGEREEARAMAAAAAVAVPSEVAELGAEVASLAAEIAGAGNPNLLGDALAAVLLAEAAAAAAASLVEINLADVAAP
jgi:formiminotetrahydrofolate cyclodeaminase